MDNFLIYAVLMPLAFGVGMAFGQWASSRKWSKNANYPRRILYRGRYYKVVELGNTRSTKIFEINNFGITRR